jgi:hypothetical protein
MKIELTSIPSFYINIKKDYQRNNNFLDWNSKLKFTNVSRISGTYSIPYYTGLATSFVNAVKSGIQTKQNFIIFEDDAEPTKHFKYEIEIPDDADAVYLGVSPWGFLDLGTSSYDSAVFNGALFESVDKFMDVFRVKNTLSCHAILYISQKYAIASLASFKKAAKLQVHSDIQINKDKLFDKYNVYAVGPFFYQNDKNKPEVLKETKDIIIKNFIKNDKY